MASFCLDLAPQFVLDIESNELLSRDIEAGRHKEFGRACDEGRHLGSVVIEGCGPDIKGADNSRQLVNVILVGPVRQQTFMNRLMKAFQVGLWNDDLLVLGDILQDFEPNLDEVLDPIPLHDVIRGIMHNLENHSLVDGELVQIEEGGEASEDCVGGGHSSRGGKGFQRGDGTIEFKEDPWDLG